MEERRRVTILFADMQGFTAASEKADPEVVADTLNLCFTRLGEEVTKYGGTVDKVIGDAIMALFGAPVAHDDDPRRAIESALGMQEAMDDLQSPEKGRWPASLTMPTGLTDKARDPHIKALLSQIVVG